MAVVAGSQSKKELEKTKKLRQEALRQRLQAR